MYTVHTDTLPVILQKQQSHMYTVTHTHTQSHMHTVNTVRVSHTVTHRQ